MHDPDRELIQRFQDGEPEAFERLIRRWSHRILNLAFRLVGDLDEAQDIRQEVNWRLYRALTDYRGKAIFSTWLHRVVLNCSRDHLRARQSRRRLLERAREERAPSEGKVEVPLAERAEQWHEVSRALSALPDREREVVVLRHYQGLRFRQIAEILEAPITTVQSRLHRGFELLRARLQRAELPD